MTRRPWNGVKIASSREFRGAGQGRTGRCMRRRCKWPSCAGCGEEQRGTAGYRTRRPRLSTESATWRTSLDNSRPEKVTAINDTHFSTVLSLTSIPNLNVRACVFAAQSQGELYFYSLLGGIESVRELLCLNRVTSTADTWYQLYNSQVMKVYGQLSHCQGQAMLCNSLTTRLFVACRNILS